MRFWVLLIAIALTAGCATTDKKSCATLSCMQNEARIQIAKNCMSYWRAREGAWKTIYPNGMDKYTWCEVYANKKVKRMYR